MGVMGRLRAMQVRDAQFHILTTYRFSVSAAELRPARNIVNNFILICLLVLRLLICCLAYKILWMNNSAIIFSDEIKIMMGELPEKGITKTIIRTGQGQIEGMPKGI